MRKLPGDGGRCAERRASRRPCRASVHRGAERGGHPNALRIPGISARARIKEWLWKRIRPIKNDVEHFGYQIVVDAENGIVKEEEVLLIQGAGYEVDQIVEKARALGGLAILAHVDRPAFSYTAALGPMPEDYPRTLSSFRAASTPTRRRNGANATLGAPSSVRRTRTSSTRCRARTARR